MQRNPRHQLLQISLKVGLLYPCRNCTSWLREKLFLKYIAENKIFGGNFHRLLTGVAKGCHTPKFHGKTFL